MVDTMKPLEKAFIIGTFFIGGLIYWALMTEKVNLIGGFIVILIAFYSAIAGASKYDKSQNKKERKTC